MGPVVAVSVGEEVGVTTGAGVGVDSSTGSEIGLVVGADVGLGSWSGMNSIFSSDGAIEGEETGAYVVSVEGDVEDTSIVTLVGLAVGTGVARLGC